MNKKILELGTDGRNSMLFHATKLYENGVISKLAYRKIEHKLEKIPTGISKRKLKEKIREIKRSIKEKDSSNYGMEYIIKELEELLK